ncbi:MAG TPA: flippase [Anaeromyxobacter sp.]|nr:flippase [Anaeromyxobacter sp.]
MTPTRALARNTLWNLVGQAAPMMAALVALPPVLHSLGTARFGVLTLFWLIVGYFSLFDLGLGRAVTQLVAHRMGTGDERSIGPVIWTAQMLMAGLGVVGGCVLALVAPLLARHLLKVPPALQAEAELSFRVIALAVPAVIVSTGLRGVLEARQLFRGVNLVRCATGLATFLGPLALVPLRPTLVSVAVVLVVSRYLTTLAFVPLCLRALPQLRRFRVDGREARGLFRFGGWITVSNVISPVMVNIDRLFIGAIISMAAVSYYATPFEIVTKITILPGALVTTLFPAFASAGGRGRPQEAWALLERGLRYVFVAVFPIALVVVLFARPLLALWLGSDFAVHAAPLLKVLAIGVFCNSLAYVPAAFIQAVGRPDLTAKLHVIELPLYLAALYALARGLGVEGVAVASALRVLLDLVLLCVASRAALPGSARWGVFVAALVAALATLILGAFGGILATLAASTCGLGILAWLAALLVPRMDRRVSPVIPDSAPLLTHRPTDD